jgi:hypothetical protein
VRVIVQLGEIPEIELRGHWDSRLMGFARLPERADRHSVKPPNTTV